MNVPLEKSKMIDLKKQRQLKEDSLKENFSDPKTPTAASILQWETSSQTFGGVSKIWLTVWFVVSLIAVSSAILMRNFLFAIFLIVASLTVIIIKYQRPRSFQVKIDPTGIWLNNEFYPFEELESFWIDYEPPLFQELIIRPKNKVKGKIPIPFEDLNPVLIHRTLKEFLPEKEESRSLFDILDRLI